MRRAPLALLACLTLGATALTGCGSDTLETGDDTSSATSSEATAEVTKDDTLAAMVPAEIAEAGTLEVGTDASYAPNEFFADDGSTIEGMDVDLFDAAAAKLGLKTSWSNADFGSLILGVDSGRYDASVSSFTINDERKKQVNMISYLDVGTQWVTQTGNPKDVKPDDACGATIGVQADTVQAEDIAARSAACTKAGKEEIKQVVETEQSAVTAGLSSGKVDAMLADSPIGLYAIQQNPDAFEALGEIYDSAPYGVVVPKEQTELADALAQAFQALEEDGTYASILKTWGQEAGAVDDFAVNP